MTITNKPTLAEPSRRIEDAIGWLAIGSRLYDPEVEYVDEPDSVLESERRVWAAMFWPAWKRLRANQQQAVRVRLEYISSAVDPAIIAAERRMTSLMTRFGRERQAKE